MNNIYLYLSIYLIILYAIVFYTRKKENKEDFLISGRDRKWRNIMFSKFAGAVGVSWFLSYTAYAYDYGLGVYIMVLGFILGYTLFAFWVAPKIYSISRKNKFYTQGDLVLYRTKSDIGKKITDIFSSFAQFTRLIVCIVGGSKVIESMGLFSYEISALIILSIVLSYVLLGGYKVVLLTDVFQGMVIIILLSFISYNIIHGANMGELFSVLKTSKIDISFVIGFFLYGIFIMISLSDRYQLCYAAKDLKSIQKGMFFTSVPIFLMASSLLFIGLFMRSQNPNLDSSLVFLEAIRGYVPSVFLPLGIVLFFSGLMSSADTHIYSISSHLGFLGNKKDIIKNIKIIAILLIILTYIVVYFFRSIIGITIFGAGLSIVMSIPMIYIIKGGNNSCKFISSIIIGIIGFFLGIFFLGLEPSIALTILLGGIIGLFVDGYF